MVLVTGGTGLVGAQLLLDLASSGKKILALRREDSSLKVFERVFSNHPELKESISWKTGDVSDIYDVSEAVEASEEIYHCAAKVSFHGSDRSLMMKINVGGTANLVNAALDAGNRKFCHVSSIAALGRAAENEVMNEQTVWKSSPYNSMYAISKYGAEREVWRAIEEGLQAVIVNPAIIIGPGEWHKGSTAMFRQVWRGMKFYSEGVNGFVDVRDVSKCMIGLMEKNISGERFVVSSENCSYREIFNTIADSYGKPHPTIKVNGTLSEFGWRMEYLRSILTGSIPFIAKETARNSQRRWFYSNEKIKQVLGMDFIPVKEAIRYWAEKVLVSSH